MFVGDLLSTSQAAQILRCSQEYVSRLVSAGTFSEARRIGGVYGIPRVEVVAYRMRRLAEAGLPQDYGGPLPRRKPGAKPGARRSLVRREIERQLAQQPMSAKELHAAIVAAGVRATDTVIYHYLKDLGAVRTPDGLWALPS